MPRKLPADHPKNRRLTPPEPHPEDRELTPAEQWEVEEKTSGRKIRKAINNHTLQWVAPGPHLMLAFVSDMHIAPGTPVDFKAMRQDAELIRDTPGCYAILGGDQVDNHIKHRSAVLAASSQPSDQYKLLEHYLTILGPKCLLITRGNHENWTTDFAGLDPLGDLAKRKQIFYAKDEAWLEVQVGEQIYHVAMRHQYRLNSSFNQTHAVKQWLRLGEREFDLGCIGHHHEAAVEQTLYRGRFRWVCRPGSYQITSAYSRQYGFNMAVPTTPTFLLHGDRHHIDGWQSLASTVGSFRALRELGMADMRDANIGPTGMKRGKIGKGK